MATAHLSGCLQSQQGRRVRIALFPPSQIETRQVGWNCATCPAAGYPLASSLSFPFMLQRMGRGASVPFPSPPPPFQGKGGSDGERASATAVQQLVIVTTFSACLTLLLLISEPGGVMAKGLCHSCTTAASTTGGAFFGPLCSSVQTAKGELYQGWQLEPWQCDLRSALTISFGITPMFVWAEV